MADRPNRRPARPAGEPGDTKTITARAGRFELAYRPGSLRITVERLSPQGEVRRHWCALYADTLARSPDALAVLLEFVEEVRRRARQEAA